MSTLWDKKNNNLTISLFTNEETKSKTCEEQEISKVKTIENIISGNENNSTLKIQTNNEEKIKLDKNFEKIEEKQEESEKENVLSKKWGTHVNYKNSFFRFPLF